MGTLEPIVAIDDLTVPPDQGVGEPRWYHARAVQGDVKATIQLRPYRGVHQGYILAKYHDKVTSSGTMGWKQEQRAKHLLEVLEQRVREALHEAGWRAVDHSSGGSDIWRYAGQASFERERQLARMADRIWRGRYAISGAEKQAPLNLVAPLLLPDLPDLQFQPVGNGLEIAVDHSGARVRVRRQRRAGQEQRLAVASQMVGIIGDEAAHERGTSPAYHRTIHTRAVTFTCAWCGRTTTQQRFPSPKPMYCSDVCKEEAQRERTRERVRRLRDRRGTATR
jgi:hypothetical protein